MKLKLKFIIATFIALIIYIPVAQGQANLTFSGGSGTKLSTTLQNYVVYTVNNTACSSGGPIFVFDEVGNALEANTYDVTGTMTYSINGGSPQRITRERTGSDMNNMSPNDLLIAGAIYTNLFLGDTVVLSVGTVTTTTAIAGARPNSGSFTTFITNSSSGVRCSGNGVAFTPTAATVSVSGHVRTAMGRGITSVQLTLTDSQGNVRTAVSTTSGYYQFEDIEVGSTYIITVIGKRYSFNQPSQVLNVNDETVDINFIGNPIKRLGSN
jgi:hypothetical protein